MSSHAESTVAAIKSKRNGVVMALVSTCLATAVLLLCLRRVMGAFSQPLPAGSLALTLLAALFATTVVRAYWQSAVSNHPAACWIPSLFVLLLAVSLGMPGIGAGGLVALGLMVLADVCIAAGLPAMVSPQFAWLKPAPRAGSLVRQEPLGPGELPHDISQQFIRRRTSQGESIEGLVRAVFAPGHRTEFYHVAFCPPLSETPKVACRQCAGPAARVKVAQILAHGVRLEIRLNEPPEAATEIVLEFTAHQPRTQA